jgi:hypothetical protein
MIPKALCDKKSEAADRRRESWRRTPRFFFGFEIVVKEIIPTVADDPTVRDHPVDSYTAAYYTLQSYYALLTCMYDDSS